MNTAGRRIAIILLVTVVATSTVHADSSLWPIKCGDKFGYVDREGMMIISPTFLEASPFDGGMASVRISSGEYAIIDVTGRKILNLNVSDLYAVRDGIVRYKENGKHYFINIGSGSRIGPYDNAKNFSEGKALVRKGSESFYIDASGRRLFPGLSISSGAEFVNGIAKVWVRESGKPRSVFGFINSEGELLIRPRFSFLGSFSEGLCAAATDDLVGYIDHQGEFTIRPQYYNAFSFFDGVACVQYKKQEKKGPPFPFWQLIDSMGKVLKKLDEDIIVFSDFSEGYAIISRTDKSGLEKYGLLDTTGTVTIEPVYDYLELFKDGIAIYRINGSAGILTTNLQIIPVACR